MNVSKIFSLMEFFASNGMNFRNIHVSREWQTVFNPMAHLILVLHLRKNGS